MNFYLIQIYMHVDGNRLAVFTDLSQLICILSWTDSMLLPAWPQSVPLKPQSQTDSLTLLFYGTKDASTAVGCEGSQTWSWSSNQPLQRQQDHKCFAHSCSNVGCDAVSNDCFPCCVCQITKKLWSRNDALSPTVLKTD